MELLSSSLAIAAGVAQTAAFLDYNRKVLSGKTWPNGATWAIWAVIALVSASTYLSATGDIWKGLMSINNIALCIGTFVFALYRGKFQKLGVTDRVALLLGVIAIVVWILSTAACANIVVQVAIVIGFIPTWQAVRLNPMREHPRPWWLWSSAYCIAVAVVFLRWRNQWIDLLFPINGALLHASVPLLALARQRRLAAHREKTASCCR